MFFIILEFFIKKKVAGTEDGLTEANKDGDGDDDVFNRKNMVSILLQTHGIKFCQIHSDTNFKKLLYFLLY